MLELDRSSYSGKAWSGFLEAERPHEERGAAVPGDPPAEASP